MTEIKSLTMLNAELLRKSKRDSPAVIHEDTRNSSSLHRHLLGLAIEADTKISSWTKRKASELKRFSDINIKNGTGLAKLVLSSGMKLDVSAMVVPFPRLSFASQTRYLNLLINRAS